VREKRVCQNDKIQIVRKENGLKIAIERSKRKLAFCILSVSDLSKGQQLLAQGNALGIRQRIKLALKGQKR
jgi:hypothetical protein